MIEQKIDKSKNTINVSDYTCIFDIPVNGINYNDDIIYLMQQLIISHKIPTKYL